MRKTVMFNGEDPPPPSKKMIFFSKTDFYLTLEYTIIVTQYTQTCTKYHINTNYIKVWPNEPNVEIYTKYLLIGWF